MTKNIDFKKAGLIWRMLICLHITLSYYKHYEDLSKGNEHVKHLSDISWWVCVLG